MLTAAQILPYLHSRSHETRSAASTALSQIFTLVPLWTPYPDAKSKPYGASSSLPAPDFPSFSVKELMDKGTLLLASSGKEFIKPTGILANSSEVKKARKEAMGRLGLDFLDSVGGADDMDLDKELAADETDQDVEMAQQQPLQPEPVHAPTIVKMEEEPLPPSPTDEFLDVKPKKEDSAVPEGSKSSTPTAAPSPAPGAGPSTAEDTTALSARERNRLKRKRKPGNSAFVAAPAPPPQGAGSKYSATPAGQSK